MNLATKVGIIVGILTVGVIVPLVLFATQQKQTQNPPSGSPQDYLKNQAGMMTNGGTIMRNMSSMMMNAGQMMQQKGSKSNDSELTQMGQQLSGNAQSMQTEGQNMMNSGNDFSSRLQQQPQQ